jgi:hypothetical protein
MIRIPVPPLLDVPVPLANLLADMRSFPELMTRLEQDYPSKNALRDTQILGTWCSVANGLRQHHRPQDAAIVLTTVYEAVLRAQGSARPETPARGTVLVFLSDTFLELGYPALALRYLVLTLCEDTLGEAEGRGQLPTTLGAYWRARGAFSMSDTDIHDLAERLANAFHAGDQLDRFSESVLLSIGDDWKRVMPRGDELNVYRVCQPYAEALLGNLGDGTGKALERLATYLLSCIPGCRVTGRVLTHSTDHDVVCAFDGSTGDFRDDLGRYVLVECKDWSRPADFTTVAKFARVLQSAKCRAGILISPSGMSGAENTNNANRERLKLYHDSGIVIMDLNESDLKSVVDGANLITLLRRKYEQVRLDARPT